MNFLSVRRQNVFDDRKTQAGSFFIQAAGFICFIEFLKDKRDFFPGDSGAGILHRDADLIFAVRFGMQRNDPSWICKFNGILNQIDEYPFY